MPSCLRKIAYSSPRIKLYICDPFLKIYIFIRNERIMGLGLSATDMVGKLESIVRRTNTQLGLLTLTQNTDNFISRFLSIY